MHYYDIDILRLFTVAMGHDITYIKVSTLSIDSGTAAQTCVGFRISRGLLICILLSLCFVSTVQRDFPGVSFVRLSG